jgi:hypothetical protein
MVGSPFDHGQLEVTGRPGEPDAEEFPDSGVHFGEGGGLNLAQETIDRVQYVHLPVARPTAREGDVLGSPNAAPA